MNSLQYEVQVKGLVINGHPHQMILSDLKAASFWYERLCELHPTKDVVLSQNTMIQLKKRDGIPVVPLQCPRGHSGNVDGKSVLKQGGSGNWVCGVCGEIWEAK